MFRQRVAISAHAGSIWMKVDLLDFDSDYRILVEQNAH